MTNFITQKLYWVLEARFLKFIGSKEFALRVWQSKRAAAWVRLVVRLLDAKYVERLLLLPVSTAQYLIHVICPRTRLHSESFSATCYTMVNWILGIVAVAADASCRCVHWVIPTVVTLAWQGSLSWGAYVKNGYRTAILRNTALNHGDPIVDWAVWVVNHGISLARGIQDGLFKLGWVASEVLNCTLALIRQLFLHSHPEFSLRVNGVVKLTNLILKVYPFDLKLLHQGLHTKLVFKEEICIKKDIIKVAVELCD